VHHWKDGTFCRRRPHADRAWRPTLGSRCTPSTSRNYGVARKDPWHLLCASPEWDTTEEAMTRILGTLIVAIFIAVALLAWVTIPT
jgi:hypothetical protein